MFLLPLVLFFSLSRTSVSALCVARGALTRGPAPRNLVTVAIYHARSVTACSSIVIGAVEL